MVSTLLAEDREDEGSRVSQVGSDSSSPVYNFTFEVGGMYMYIHAWYAWCSDCLNDVA